MSKVRRASENQYSRPRRDFLIGILAMTWMYMGRGLLGEVLDSDQMIWIIYILVMAVGVVAVFLTRRAEKAAHQVIADNRSLRNRS